MNERRQTNLEPSSCTVGDSFFQLGIKTGALIYEGRGGSSQYKGSGEENTTLVDWRKCNVDDSCGPYEYERAPIRACALGQGR